MPFEEKVALMVRKAVEIEQAKLKEGQRVVVEVYETLIDGQKHMRVDANCVDIQKVEYKITFELLDCEYNSLTESRLCDALCQLIDQGKTRDESDEKFDEEERDRCLAIVKKHIGRFSVEVDRVSK